MSNNHILSVHLSNHMFQIVISNNMYHHNKLKKPMDHPIEKLESMDESLRVDQRCRDIEQEWYENKQI